MLNKSKDKPYVNKENNSTMGMPDVRRKMMTYFQFSLIGVVLVVVFAIIYLVSTASEQKNKIDYTKAKLIQYEIPSDDTPVVVYETDKGAFKSVLYTDEAPEYCEYYQSLVNSGYYDGTYVFAVQDGVYFMGGSKTSDGTDDDNTDTNEYDPEKSEDLWPFYGAMAAYGNKKSVFNSQIQAGSRILFIGSIDFDEDTVNQLDSISENKELNNAFTGNGGVPNFSQQYTIFGQVYDGLDTYSQILSTEVVKPSDSEDENADSDLRPTKELKFNKVYMSTYGENKNDTFFTEGAKGNALTELYSSSNE